MKTNLADGIDQAIEMIDSSTELISKTALQCDI